MAIRIPTSDQSKIFLGSQEIGAVYVGANKVWPDAPVVDPNAFIMEFNMSTTKTLVLAFFNASGYNCTISWGDGTTSTLTAYDGAGRSHTYVDYGTYQVTISGTCPGVFFNNNAATGKNYLSKIIQWGDVNMTSLTAAFYGCMNLIEQENYSCAPISATSIGNNAFYGCSNIQRVDIPQNITSLGDYVFTACHNLISCSLPSSIKTIGIATFQYCVKLTDVSIPNLVSQIPWGLFYNCSSLSSIVIPSSVISIGPSSFRGCSSLSSIVIPSSVTAIGASAFTSSGILTYVCNPITPPTLGSSPFANNQFQIKVPAASVAAYKAAAGWSAYASRIVAQ